MSISYTRTQLALAWLLGCGQRTTSLSTELPGPSPVLSPHPGYLQPCGIRGQDTMGPRPITCLHGAFVGWYPFDFSWGKHQPNLCPWRPFLYHTGRLEPAEALTLLGQPQTSLQLLLSTPPLWI